MKNNYPIKYAVIPMYEQTGWIHGLNELERDYNIVAYIVSKCYLISETKEYSGNGKANNKYEIVFPYEKTDAYGDWLRKEPNFNYANKCTNSIIVNDIFENYTDAKKICQQKNEELLIQKLSQIPFDKLEEQLEKIKSKHNEIVDNYTKLEQQIIKSTQDLNLKEELKEQSIITTTPMQQRFIDISLYEYINFCEITKQPFLVYNISKTEYERMKKKIKEDKIITDKDLKSSTFIMEYIYKNGTTRIIDSDFKCSSFYLKEGNLYYDKNISKFNISETDKEMKYTKIYTLETYEDIIKSFIPKYIEKPGNPRIEINDVIISKKLIYKNK